MRVERVLRRRDAGEELLDRHHRLSAEPEARGVVRRERREVSAATVAK
jgi:hypothetical protein